MLVDRRSPVNNPVETISVSLVVLFGTYLAAGTVITMIAEYCSLLLPALKTVEQYTATIAFWCTAAVLILMFVRRRPDLGVPLIASLATLFTTYAVTSIAIATAAAILRLPWLYAVLQALALLTTALVMLWMLYARTFTLKPVRPAQQAK